MQKVALYLLVRLLIVLPSDASAFRQRQEIKQLEKEVHDEIVLSTKTVQKIDEMRPILLKKN